MDRIGATLCLLATVAVFSTVSATPVDCDFNTNICGWTQSTQDDFDMPLIVNRGGGFLYSNEKALAPGNKTRLISPIVPSGGGIKCFSFLMMKNRAGVLNIYQKIQANETKIWLKRARLNSGWHPRQLDILNDSHDYQLVIEFVVTTNSVYIGDIGLDDIKLVNGSCPQGEPTFNCTFDVDLCGWRQPQLEEDTFDWIRKTGKTSSKNTGPISDHTGGGYYMYIESSPPVGINDAAHLISPEVSPGPKSISFYYHMYGTSTGHLNVWLMKNRSDPITKWDKVLFKTGNKGDQWLHQTVDLPQMNQPYHVVIGVVHQEYSGYYGDIAIDDITIVDGPSQEPSFNCSFGDGPCGWTSAVTGVDFDWYWVDYNSSSTYSDHTGEGGMMEIRGGSPLAVGVIAQLISPTIEAGNYFVTLYHNLRGGASHVGLDIYIKFANRTKRGYVDSVKLIGNGLWMNKTISVYADTKSEIIIEGVIKSASTFEVLIDGIEIVKTSLPALGTFDCSFSSDFCGWKQEYGDDDIYFRRYIGSASPPRVFVERDSQSNYRKARLISPVVPDGGDRCLIFDLYKTGASRFNVYQKMQESDNLTKIWYKWNALPSKWMKQYVDISSGSKPFQVLFEVESAYSSYYARTISLAEIKLQNGSCPEAGQSFNCTFDSGLCGWRQSMFEGDTFDWERNSGKTPSLHTGPTGDHTGGGYYMYIETTPPVGINDAAHLISPEVSPGPKSLSFYYHMNGINIGHLNVWLMKNRSDPIAKWDKVLFKSGNKGNQWLHQTVDLPHMNQPYYVVFEGVEAHTGHYGDTAIDDVTIVDGPSQEPSFNCSFGDGPCGWTSAVTGVDSDWYWVDNSSSNYSDHTGEGGMMKIRGGSPLASGDIAQLISPTIEAGNYFVTLYHNLRGGATFMSLDIYIKFANRTKPGYVDSVKLITNGLWMKKTISVYADTKSEIIIEGVIKSASTFEVLIDGIEIVKTSLPALGTFDCSFSSDFCGWKQEYGDDDIYFRRYIGPASPPRVFVERHSQVKYRKARLISPVVPDGGDRCLIFDLYKTGASRFNVYQKMQESDHLTKIWYKWNALPSKWMKQYVDISSGSKPFQVSVEVESALSSYYTRTISLAEIKLQNGSCPEAGQSFNCTFDSGLCGWRQSIEGDTFDWERNSGKTPSSNTGPTGDHTGGGYYMYIETSSPVGINDTAHLISPEVSPGPKSLSFYYHMYGIRTGHLNVWLMKNRSDPITKWDKVLFKSGNKGNQWLHQTVDLPHMNQSYYVVFEGVEVHSGPYGDMAIDDVTIVDGPSQEPSFNCSFEDGSCGWTSAVTGVNFDWYWVDNSSSPFTDYTGEGGMMMAKGGKPLLESHKAQLVSPLMEAGEYNITYHYRMDGNKNITLMTHVMLKDQPNTMIDNETIFETTWTTKTQTLYFATEAQLILEAVLQDSWTDVWLAVDGFKVELPAVATTMEPTTEEPTMEPTTEEPTMEPTTQEPTMEPTTEEPMLAPGHCYTGTRLNATASKCDQPNSACVAYKVNGLMDTYECVNRGFCKFAPVDKQCCCYECTTKLCNAMSKCLPVDFKCVAPLLGGGDRSQMVSLTLLVGLIMAWVGNTLLF